MNMLHLRSKFVAIKKGIKEYHHRDTGEIVVDHQNLHCSRSCRLLVLLSVYSSSLDVGTNHRNSHL